MFAWANIFLCLFSSARKSQRPRVRNRGVGRKSTFAVWAERRSASSDDTQVAAGGDTQTAVGGDTQAATDV